MSFFAVVADLFWFTPCLFCVFADVREKVREVARVARGATGPEDEDDGKTMRLYLSLHHENHGAH